MPKLTIDGKTIEMPKGSTVLQAAQALGIYIPRYCYHPSLSISGTCRMCAVEIEKAPRLRIACATEITEGMIVRTGTEAVKKARTSVLEFLLANHPVDCPICDQAGECFLQDYYMDHGLHKSRFALEDKILRQKRLAAGKYLVLDNERCILCTRCVRFCEEVTKTNELTVSERNDSAFIDLRGGRGLDNDYSLNIADLCPVGAFTSADFRFKQRVWFLKKVKSVCTGCATGCNIEVHYNQNTVYRLMPSPNPETNTWLCDNGRMTYKVLEAGDRLRKALVKRGSMELEPSIRQAAHLMDEAVRKTGPDSVAVLGSPYLSLEDNLALAELAAVSIKTPHLCLDFPSEQGIKDGILINKDPAPNTNGLKLLRTRYPGPSRAALAELINSGRIKLIVAEARALNSLKDQLPGLPGMETVILAAARSELSFSSGCVLPYAVYFETEGHFVNYNGLVQKTAPAVAAPEGVKPLWTVLSRISSYTGAPIRFEDAAELGKKISELVKQL
ncbi:MAG: 2Fe-2S iron-sulfur cluster-binding protein [Elusimicrobiales bacterium]|jgi:NADH-quinone oxidoreductase subunit G